MENSLIKFLFWFVTEFTVSAARRCFGCGESFGSYGDVATGGTSQL